ncbi:hypothetical protein J8V57_09780 [Xenorhabdus sp. PB61.4]|uniref:hypothetical protein n=1 Tax=Xenorhabdus sp. PB61.4 TaxID=2788940 RepID=UPI001E309440|nr:hypothetical protein [Xenorhabdus sp. PB61.4]MCC8366570.1 hypothetical protein [Xenorhabdus sp. PB61.4]
MRYDRSPYASQDEAWEQQEEKTAYQEAVQAEQGDKAQELYDSLPQDIEAILSPKMMEIFGSLLDKNSDALEHLNNLLYDLSLLKVQWQEAA